MHSTDYIKFTTLGNIFRDVHNVLLKTEHRARSPKACKPLTLIQAPKPH